MGRRAVYFLLAILLWSCPLISVQNALTINDIPRVIDRFLNFHIENKELSNVLVRRSMKIYIEQFDPDKSYLLEQEVEPYLNMSEKRAHEILARLKQQDYSDFVALNRVMQQAILRAERMRGQLAGQMVSFDLDQEAAFGSVPSRFARKESELAARQKLRMVRFLQYHKTRSEIDSMDRRAKVFALFEKKVRRMEYNYLFLDRDAKALSQGQTEHLLAVRILKSFAKSLDTHTSFFSPEEAYEMRLTLEKRFEGVGVVLSEGIDGIMIAELIQGSPAERSGQIRVNDLLVEIDGVALSQVAFEEVLDLLKKKDRGELVLGFKRTNLQTQKADHFRVSLTKKPIVMNDERIQVSSEKVGSGVIGKISLHSFYESTDGATSERDIKEAIRGLREQGNLVGLVLDLRENSGGFLSQAVKVAGLFVSNGVIVISKYGKGETHFLRNVTGKSFYNGPLVVLTSKMSASASEIVAQALQDYGVALVVGDETTFGKGSIQYQTVTDPNAELFFKVTVGRYYTVSGKSTQIEGVKADIVVPTQYAPYNIGEKFLEYPLSADTVNPAYVDSLNDLDEKTRRIFQARYLPFLQRVVPFWKKMLPELKKNSAERLASNPNFQLFLHKQEKIRARQNSIPVNTIDEEVRVGDEDLQMIEAVYVVKDMIHMEAEAKPQEILLQTGS